MFAQYPYSLRSRSDSSPQHPGDVQAGPSSENAGHMPHPSNALARSTSTNSASRLHSDARPLDTAPRSKPRKHKILRMKRPASANSGMPDKMDFESSVRKDAIMQTVRAPGSPRVESARRPSTSSGLRDSKASRAGSVPRPSPQHSISFGDPREGSFPFPHAPDVVSQHSEGRNNRDALTRLEIESLHGAVKFAMDGEPIPEDQGGKMRDRKSQTVNRNGKKHHGYTVQEVPYPRNYDRQVIDHDIWNTMWAQQLSGSITWHVFKDAPAKVLDLGCGTGTWILDAAKLWKETQFAGLDIMPLHPNLQQLGMADLDSRVTWVQANFLERLPFSDEEFDYVRIKRIARGVPENKWDDLFEEIARVMKPGGAFELVEEELHFPGILPDCKPNAGLAEQLISSTSLFAPFDRPRAPTPASCFFPGDTSTTDCQPDPSPVDSHHQEDNKPTDNRAPELYTPDTQSPPSHLPYTQSRVICRPPINPHDHSLLETIYNEMHASRFINLQPLSLLNNSISLYFKNVLSHPPLMVMFPPLPDNVSDRRTTPHVESGRSQKSSVDVPSVASSQQGQVGKRSSTESDNHRTPNWLHLPQLIEGTEYVKVDRSRFFSFQPPSRTSTSGLTSESSSRPITPSIFEQAGTLFSSSSPRTSISGLDDQQLIAHFIRLPNHTVRFDLRSLNMHLSLQVQEVLACADAMWNFVADYQNSHLGRERSSRDSELHVDSHAASLLARQSTADAQRSTLLELSRKDFDDMLLRFELDMSESVNFNAMMQDRLNWDAVMSDQSQRRREFDAMCATWAQYQAELRGEYNYFDDRRSPATVVSPPESSHHSSELHDSTHPVEASGRLSAGPREPSLNQVDHAANRRSFPSDYVPPSHRLSRTVRVFVAWKGKA